MSAANGVLLEASLALAVPLRIAELERAGGPSDLDRELVQALTDDLIAHGDNLLYRSEHKGESARLFVQVADALAVLAFQPGGVRVFGQRWEGRVPV